MVLKCGTYMVLNDTHGYMLLTVIWCLNILQDISQDDRLREDDLPW